MRVQQIAFWVVVMLASPARSAERMPRDGDEVVADILQDWDKRRRKFAAMHYKGLGTQTIHKGGQTGEVQPPPGKDPDAPFPSTDVTGDIEYEWLMRFGEGTKAFGARTVRTIPVYSEKYFDFIPYTQKCACRPDYLRTYESGNHAFRQAKKRGGPGECYEFIDSGLLSAHGFPPVHGRSTFEPFRAADDYRFNGFAEHDGRECAVLQTKPNEIHSSTPLVSDLYVVEEWDSAVVKIAYMPYGSAWTIEVDYEANGDTWLPTAIREIIPNPDRTPFRRKDVRITSAVIDPKVDDRDFEMDLIPGARLTDLDVQKTYVIESDLSLTEIDSETGEPIDKPVGRFIAMAIVAFAAAAIVVAVARRLFRRLLTDSRSSA